MINQKDATAEAFVYYPRLTKVKKYVGQHLEDKISLATAAQIAGLEEKYLFPQELPPSAQVPVGIAVPRQL